MLLSGVHGPEGFAGSAIQIMFLNEFRSRFQSSRISLLLVHALNPYGYKYGRRTTEMNINLNRNFGLDPALYQTENPGYRKLAHVLAPTAPASLGPMAIARLTSSLYGRVLFRQFTADQLRQAISLGQFEFEKGLEYGGKTQEPQVQDFIKICQPILNGYDEILCLDLHTGLGDRYKAHMLRGEHPRSVDESLFKKYFKLREDRDIYHFNLGSEKGFYKTLGDSNSLLAEMATPAQKVCALTLEFGTLGNGQFAKMDSLLRLVLENQGHHFGYRSRKQEKSIKQRYLELFAPAEKRWRENSIEKARQLFERLLQRF
jgi:hypothetical protein